MKSYPTFQQVCEGLGDKVLHSISRAAVLARSDLKTYRKTFPSFVAEASERGLAAWIHDRFFYHFAFLMDGVEDVRVHDREPTREIIVRMNYRMRIKRHHEEGLVSSYPTQGFLEFVTQPAQIEIEGLEEIRLFAGYDWDRDARDLRHAVLSLHDGKDKPVWCEPVPYTGDDDDSGSVIQPPPSAPDGPTVDTSGIKPQEEEDSPE